VQPNTLNQIKRRKPSVAKCPYSYTKRTCDRSKPPTLHGAPLARSTATQLRTVAHTILHTCTASPIGRIAPLSLHPPAHLTFPLSLLPRCIRIVLFTLRPLASEPPRETHHFALLRPLSNTSTVCAQPETQPTLHRFYARCSNLEHLQ